MNRHFVDSLKIALANNGGKIPFKFIEDHLNDPLTKVTHVQATKNTRICVITLTTGHELVGFAQVLDAKNDVEATGQEVAYENAKENIWAVFGAIAKVM